MVLLGLVPDTLTSKQRLNLLLAGNQISSLSSSFCTTVPSTWMGGNVGALGCEAFLCPVGSYNSIGRKTATEPCQDCTENAQYYGQTKCGTGIGSSGTGSGLEGSNSIYNERTVLVSFYNRMGGIYWKQKDNWLNPGNRYLPMVRYHVLKR